MNAFADGVLAFADRLSDAAVVSRVVDAVVSHLPQRFAKACGTRCGADYCSWKTCPNSRYWAHMTVNGNNTLCNTECLTSCGCR